MTFNTAIFYDIENLLKGYSFTQRQAANLSLKEIIKSIIATDRLGDIAVQRAYANWSDPRLAVMRGDINDIGIDPIQVFGFSYDQKKNAADLQLAIDAIDLAHIRPSIEIFVIISGDGGFASLVKKLHEYGKTVIGCAYRDSTNKSFRTVCDDFVWLTDPEEDENHDLDKEKDKNDKNRSPILPPCGNTRNQVLLKKIKKVTPADSTGMIIAKAREVLTCYADSSAFQRDLSGKGLFLSEVQEGIKIGIPDFSCIRFGFGRFIEFLQFATSGTTLCVAQNDGQPKLLSRTSLEPHISALPDLPMPDLHSLPCYLSLLSSGKPQFRLQSPDEILAVACWLEKNPPDKSDIGAIIEQASSETPDITSETIKHTIFALISAEVFLCEPAGANIYEQSISARANLLTAKAMLAELRTTIKTKISTILAEEVDESVLDDLVPQA